MTQIDPGTPLYKALTQFQNRIDTIYDPDYGDFKRKFNRYLTDLLEIFPTSSVEKRNTLLNMRHQVLFNSYVDNTDSTKKYISEIVDTLIH